MSDTGDGGNASGSFKKWLWARHATIICGAQNNSHNAFVTLWLFLGFDYSSEGIAAGDLLMQVRDHLSPCVSIYRTSEELAG